MTIEVEQAERNLRKLNSRAQERQKIRQLLGHKNRARAFYGHFDLYELEQFQELLSKALDKKRIEEQERQARNNHKSEALEKIYSIMTEYELSPDDITEPEKIKKERPRIVKYKCEIFNNVYYWTGQGSMPKPFKCYLASGNSIESIQLSKSEMFISKSTVYSRIPPEFKQSAKSLLDTHRKKKMDTYIKHPIKVDPEELPIR